MKTQREIYEATVRHEPHDRFLYYAGFTPDLEKRVSEALGVPAEGIAEKLGFFRPVNVGGQSGRNYRVDEREDLAEYYRGCEIPEGSYIDANGTLHVPGSMYHFTHYVSPLRNAVTLSEVEAFPFVGPPVHDTGALSTAAAAVRDAGGVSVCWSGHIYENAWQVRGYQEFLMDMIGAPEICEYVLDRYTENALAAAEAAARAGVDYIRTGDDVANQNDLMFAPEVWRRFMKTRWAKVYAAARRIKPDIGIWYHSDGNITRIIPELIEIGVTILNPVQPECMDLPALKRSYGSSLVFDGTIGTQTTMPFGSPEEVREAVRRSREVYGADGGLILSPTHVLEPEVPIGNIMAFVEECAR